MMMSPTNPSSPTDISAPPFCDVATPFPPPSSAGIKRYARSDCFSPSPRHSLPSATMTTAEYLRVHANAPPSKLRNIIKNQIFVHDDVDYLKRLVKDVGMDYVFRFLWYDGPVPTEDDVGIGAEAGRSTVGGGRKRPQSAAPPKFAEEKSRIGVLDKRKTFGRTWIQYCCYHNAHQCLQWIFQQIVANHLDKQQQYQRLQSQERITDVSSMTGTDHKTDTSGLSNDDEDEDDDDDEDDEKEEDDGDDKDLRDIIKELLEFPSAAYCGTNYVAVATLRNSYQCLSLLIEYGGLNPDAPINNHGTTAAHLASWKDHVECLRVLQSGTYACHFDDGGRIEELSYESATTGDSEESEKERDLSRLPSRRKAFSSILTASEGEETMWSANWNKTNAMGDTPMHIAAREGCLKSMQFFLDLAITSATSALSEEEMEDESFSTIDFSSRDKDGLDCAALAAKHDQAGIITLLSESIERLLDLSIDLPDEFTSPSSSSREFWQNPFSFFQPQSDHGPATSLSKKTRPLSPIRANGRPDHGSSLAKKTPPPSPIKGGSRRRAKSEPVNIYASPVRKPPQSPNYSQSHRQQCLPHFFPTLNLRNSLERYNHETAVHVAARIGNCSVIKALFDSGNCDTTARDSLGQTALHVAALEGKLDACQMIVHLASDGDQFEHFDVVDILGRTPLYIACSMGNPPLARILVSASNWRVTCHERRKSPDGPLYVDFAHQPPLHAAVVNDHVNTVSELLDCGVDVNQGDPDGRTAISAAAKLGYLDMCQMLIMHGAHVNTRSTRAGPTPYQKAKKYKHQDVADLLYEFGGR